MNARIEDYALIGNCRAAALVSKYGSIDWLCLPRFDSGACFSALLGTSENGCWQIHPVGEYQTRREYRQGSLVLDTTFETPHGSAKLRDCMLIEEGDDPSNQHPTVLRIVEGLTGEVNMHFELVIRFDYGSIVPWVRKVTDGIHAIGGPDGIRIQSPIPLHGENFRTVADFTVKKGEVLPFALRWHPSIEEIPPILKHPERAERQTLQFWRDWIARSRHQGPRKEAVNRSLVTLKALTHSHTGGIVAAATTSLPESLGGVRNWDYRFCWLRDATFTLYSLINSGYEEEAKAWREWLLRAIAGRPSDLNIMYGLSGERRLTEVTLDWLPGYEGSRPVRTGNAASKQLQWDVYGEVIDSLFLARNAGLKTSESAWRIELKLLDFVGKNWHEPDSGIWEMRGKPRNFTHSKVMLWVALDRAIKTSENHGLSGDLERWRKLREVIHDDVCRQAFDREMNSFVQSYGSNRLDASLLLMTQVGFLPITDPKIQGTVRAIERDLMRDGFVLRYSADDPALDGLPPGEGAFLACSFWLADNLWLMDRKKDATEIFDRLLSIRNDVGLLAEEYDPRTKRQLGNFPQAFSHVSLINTACNLSPNDLSPAQHRQHRPT